MKRTAKDQSELDLCAEGMQIGRLNQLIGPEAVNYTAGLEDLYEKMLCKIENLARLVEASSAKVVEQVSLLPIVFFMLSVIKVDFFMLFKLCSKN